MKKIYALIGVLSLAIMVSGNNVSVTSLSLTGKNTTNQTYQVQFNISWDNSWRINIEPQNWDAAWVFVKYRVNTTYTSAAGATSSGTTVTVTTTTGLRVGMPVRVKSGVGVFAIGAVVETIVSGTTFTVSGITTALSGGASVVEGIPFWQHAKINTNGNSAPSGCSIMVGSDNKGAFLYRNTDGIGTFTKSGAQLQWHYGGDAVADDASIDIRAFAIEMVYVPNGNFELGGADPTNVAAFYTYGTTNTPFTIATTQESSGLAIGAVSGQLYYSNSQGGDRTGTLTGTFPCGYSAFWCMKYEISQQEYVDFLNTLNRTQQFTRVRSSIPEGTTSVTARYVMSGQTTMTYRNGIRCDATIPANTPVTFYCDYNGNGTGGETGDGQWIACDLLQESDVFAFLAWSALRPMTEFEFEKACRGSAGVITNEFAWGNADRSSSVYTLSNPGTNAEVIGSNYSISAGNAAWYSTDPSVGPFRVGIFAGTSGNYNRMTSGGTYYGIMEMSGNMAETIISVGNASGRAFTNTNGAGTLNYLGNSVVSTWPDLSSSFLGCGHRGGCWGSVYGDEKFMYVGSRLLATKNGLDPLYCGGRGVRN